MGFRTVVITSHCKCSYKNGYMLIKEEKMTMIHVSEISTVMFETPAVSLTGVLLSELANNKVCIIFCNEKHLPQGQYVPFSSHFMSSSHISEQANWSDEMKDLVWGQIVRQKIKRQGDVLLHESKNDEYKLLMSYAEDVIPGDPTNREGFAAKVYFNALFDDGFSRRDEDIAYNSCLDYGYAILLAIVSREIVRCGYSLAMGIHHHGVFNSNNLACDVMEPFRPVVDRLVLSHYQGSLNQDMKHVLWGLGNEEILMNGKNTYLTKAVEEFFRDICDFINHSGGCLSEYDFKW